MRRAGCFRCSEWLRVGAAGRERPGGRGSRGGQMFAARCAPSLRRGAVGGWAGCWWLTEWWCWWPRGVLGLHDWGCGAPYGGRYERARERACERRSNGRRTCSLAGHMRVCAHPKSRGSGILRSVLRAIFQPVLRPVFHAALRNRGHQRSGAEQKWLRTRLGDRDGAESRQPPGLLKSRCDGRQPCPRSRSSCSPTRPGRGFWPPCQ
ncbi:Uncharacterised protein [Mycobacteroides abscessus subsp. abscessus]|nr:Uncharacterised protein [Mycobacteroides abscessus subsp. abscessus]